MALKAEVPFAFHVGSKVMEPGTIHVRMLSGTNGGHAMIVNNYAARRGYIVLPKQVGDAPKSWLASGDAEVGLRLQHGGLCTGEDLDRPGQRLRLLRPQDQGRRNHAHGNRDEARQG